LNREDLIDFQGVDSSFNPGGGKAEISLEKSFMALTAGSVLG